MHLSSIEYKAEFRKMADKVFNEGGNRMRYKTVTEEIFEEGIEQGREEGLKEGLNRTLRAIMKLGLLTDEQLALVTEQVETE